MGRIAKILLTVIVSFIVSAVLTGIAVFIADRISTWDKPANMRFSFEAILWISILVPTVPAVISGLVIAGLSLRPLKAAVVGLVVYLIPIVLMGIYVAVTESNPDYSELAEYASQMIAVLGLIGAINGAICGAINLRYK